MLNSMQVEDFIKNHICGDAKFHASRGFHKKITYVMILTSMQVEDFLYHICDDTNFHASRGFSLSHM